MGNELATDSALSMPVGPYNSVLIVGLGSQKRNHRTTLNVDSTIHREDLQFTYIIARAICTQCAFRLSRRARDPISIARPSSRAIAL